MSQIDQLMETFHDEDDFESRPRHRPLPSWMSALLTYLTVSAVLGTLMLALVLGLGRAGSPFSLPEPNALATPTGWRVFGVEIGQPQIIVTGLILTVIGLIVYRYLNRGNRYDGDSKG